MAQRSIPVPENREGEFELVLGNKQLLSIFFIVVVLLGVFFTMGYIVGRNSASNENVARQPQPDAAAERTPPPVATDTPPEPVAPPKTEETKPVEKPLEVAPVTARILEPQPGETYMQVLAVAKPEAEVLAEVLVKKGFRAHVAAGPSERIFRVLVGPAQDVAELSKLKGDLEQAGFKNAFPKKY